jgi:hypothetical protein
LSLDCGALLANASPCEPVFTSGFFGADDIFECLFERFTELFTAEKGEVVFLK